MSYEPQTFVLTPFEENCYVLVDSSGECVLIDPGEASENLIEFVEVQSLQPQMILLTHGHFDHFGGAAELKRRWDIPIAIHSGDADLVGPRYGGGAVIFGLDVEPIMPDRLLEDGDVISMGPTTLSVIHTPGHSPGSVTFYDEVNGRAFCGDLIFRGAIGRYDLPGSDAQALFHSLWERILTMPDEVVLFPGHGPKTTVGHERVTNPFLTGC
jgi:glyoxylase-like metal-dependent hydrolase (beta-lactamase superfamily II)